MTKTAKIILAIVIICLVAGVGALIATKKPANKSVAFKIGVVTPLTGEASAWGNWVKNSFLLAQKEIANSQIELIFEDSMCDPKTGITAYNKLKNVDKVDMVTGFVCSSVAMAVAPLAEADGITMITTGASATDLKEAGERVFNMWPLNDAQGVFVADYFIRQGVKKAAIIYVNNDFGVTMKDAFKGQFEKAGGEVVKIETVAQEATDIRTQLAKIKETNPEYVFLATYYENAGFTLKQNQELGYGLKFIGSIDTYNQRTKEIAGSAILGYQYSKPKASDITVYQRYQSNYQAKYGQKPDLPGEAAYDTLYLINNALKQGVDIEQYFLSVNEYVGASGKFSIDEKGNIIKEFEIVEVIE